MGLLKSVIPLSIAISVMGVGTAWASTNADSLINLGYVKEWGVHKPADGCWCDIPSSVKYVKHGEHLGFTQYWRSLWWQHGHGDEPGGVQDSGAVSGWELMNSKGFNKNEQYEWTGYNSDVDKFTLRVPVGAHNLEIKKVGTWGDQIDKKAPGVYVPTWHHGAEAAYSILFDGVGSLNFEEWVEPALEVCREYPDINLGLPVTVSEMDASEWTKLQSVAKEGHEVLNGGYDSYGVQSQWRQYFDGDVIPTGDPLIHPDLRGLKVTTGICPAELTIKLPYTKYGDDTPESGETVTENIMYRVADYVNNTGDNTGRISTNSMAWSDEESKNIPALKLYCYPGWDKTNAFGVQLKAAKDVIDEEYYQKLETGGETQYFVAPQSVVSDQMIDTMLSLGYVGALGGLNSCLPTNGDFYNAFRTHFDKFYMMDANATKVFPDNPFMRLGLQAFVDNLIKSKGYMIRRINGCGDIMSWDETYHVPGSIPKSLLKDHLHFVDGKIKNNELYVGTPSEVAKTRVLQDAIQKVTITPSLKNEGFVLHAEMDDYPESFDGEINVIVVFEESFYVTYLHYTNHKGHPIKNKAKKLDGAGKIWSISFNPSHGDVYMREYIGIGDECDHIINSDAVSTVCTHEHKAAAEFHGLTNKQLHLTLPEGVFEAKLCNAAGKVIRSGALPRGTHLLNLKDVAPGVYLFTLRNAQKVILSEKVVVQ